MDRSKVIFFSVAVVAFAFLAFFAFSFTSSTRTTIFDTNSPRQVVQAVTTPAPAKTAQPGAAAAALATERQQRFTTLTDQLRELPRESELSEDLAAQEAGIQQLKVRVADLQALLSRNYGALMAESASVSLGASSQQRIAFDRAVAELQAKIGTAKVAVVEQRQVLNKFAGSDSTDITRGYEKELSRRQRLVTELEEDLADLFAAEQERAARKDARQAARLRSWRVERTALENEYTASLAALEEAQRTYQLMLKNAAESRIRTQQLEQERARLQAR